MSYDLVIIGAGIQGAGVAQAAAAAGYSVLVLEQSAIAAGTSRASSKLIHGGLRYLESGQLSLVRESLRERALLLKLAPELVRLQPLHIPIYHDSSRSPATIYSGLWLYKILAGLSSEANFSRVSRRDWAELDGLKTQGLRQVFRYYEAQTNDALLTAAVLASAQSLGADVRIPAEFIGAQLHAEGCEIEYRQSGQSRSVRSRVLVNCSGPWVTQTLARVTPQQPSPAVELVQGSHLLLPPLLKHRFYLEAPQDRRAVFALPWEGRLLLGTTETPHAGAPEDAHCLDRERDYLLETLCQYFPTLEIPPVGEIDSFAGLRVLPRSEQSAFGRSREVLFHTDNPEQPRLLSLMGGKLTTYRATAEQAMARLAPSLPKRPAIASTTEIPLTPPR
ncbi:glycerol-3-phosphate dehydrogenase/oxidase [Marinimicrobium sp. ABcell2]|uniref:glycerol-3-phosphate dehydrogenase/oxidase n=1 Tax=Marinimicrobium sp. ABcell2 TaxID=3069751 RepID=UPI0027B423FB|nr:FAD-dependent oxidoreductase [Marinimicrobium sp. ABcell2]MDQ2078442.1 FAD-dependent oxidoreductase [Marinimicrobium sp. ABcell2]